MAKSIFEIEGMDVLQAKIKKLANDKDKRREIIKILRRSARSTVLAARGLAPVSKRPMPISQKAKKKRQQPGTGSKSINTEVMRKSKNPMIIVGPRSKKKYDGWYVRQFVIPGHNIYTTGFKRKHRAGANEHGVRSKVAPNYFMNKAEQITEGKVRADAIAQMERFIQKQINKL